MTKIVFLDRNTIGPSVDLTRPRFPHDWENHGATTPDRIVERAGDAEIIVTNKVPLRADTLAELPKLGMIAVAATGYDIIDLEVCAERGIVVSNVRGYAVNAVPEHTLALMLALSRSLAPYRASVIAGCWQEAGQFTYFDYPVRDLAGRTLGLIGAGAIGSSVAKLAEAFGMRVLISGRKSADSVPEGHTPFNQILCESDVISLHCPLTPETRDLIAAPEFAQMARQPLLINTARGGLINEADCAAALEAGRIAGIGFDCLTREPPDDGNPLMTIADRPNVIITPHSAWASDAAMQTLWHQVIENIENYRSGTPSNTVTPQ